MALEGMAALGLASNILQLIDFSYNLVSGANEIRNSAAGVSAQHETFEAVSQRLIQLVNNVDGTSSSQIPPEIRTLAAQTKDLAQSFIAKLDELKPRGPKRPWSGFIQAMKEANQSDKLSALNKRLNMLQRSLNSHLLILMRQQLVQANEMVMEDQRLHFQTTVEVQRLRNDITAVLGNLAGQGQLGDLKVAERLTNLENLMALGIENTERKMTRSKSLDGEFLGEMNISSSENWLNRFEKISRYIKSTAKGKTPVKIAVLDTGCNLEASVFSVPGTRQCVIDGWKDMAGDEKMPIDEDPGQHGTRIISILLRIAPNAEILIARVAPDKKRLHKSHQHIANAIKYAAEYWKADIISMSFGFKEEIAIIRDAIDEAYRITDQAIIFLAAAGNDGGNSPELFPAYLDSVISIRGTDHSGDFVSSLNPGQHDFNLGQPAYGTLGVSVPYSWPFEDDSKVMTGCSIATPIAAAIVALIINCAAESDQKLIRTRRAILTVFKWITTCRSSGLLYLAPWQLVHTDDKEARQAFLHAAIQKLPKRH